MIKAEGKREEENQSTVAAILTGRHLYNIKKNLRAEREEVVLPTGHRFVMRGSLQNTC